VLQEIYAILRELRDEPVGAHELEKAKRRFRWDLEAAFDDPDALAGWYAGTELFRAPEPVELRLARMEAVTSADIQRAAKRLVRPDRLTVAAVGVLNTRLEAQLRRLVNDFA
jgi:predicted Zn-dependent peptidase